MLDLFYTMRIAVPILVSILLSTAVWAQTARVTHVSDGDSFVIATGERVRMIGINAPELADEFGRESKAHLARLIVGKTVTLERDPQNEDRDVHGRLLRFVTVDGTDINRQMIADGYASAFLRYPFSEDKQQAYREAEQAARASRLGFWGAQKEVGRTAPGRVEIERPAPDMGATESFFRRKEVCLGGGIVFLVLIALGARLFRRR